MYYKYDNMTLYYEKHGNQKQTIIILPGWGDTRKTFDGMIALFKEYFTIYIFDYPGFGNSTLSKDSTVFDYADLIDNFLNDNKIINPIVISHSFGTRLAIILAGKKQTKFKKLIIMDGAGIRRRKSLKIILKQYTYKFLKKMVVLVPKKRKKRYLKKLINIFASSDYKSINDNLRKTFINIINEDLRMYLKDIKCPTLLIWGEKDLDTKLKDGHLMNKKIPDSGLVVIKNAGHFPYLDNPIYIKRIIYEFLKPYISK